MERGTALSWGCRNQVILNSRPVPGPAADRHPAPIPVRALLARGSSKRAVAWCVRSGFLSTALSLHSTVCHGRAQSACGSLPVTTEEVARYCCTFAAF